MNQNQEIQGLIIFQSLLSHINDDRKNAEDYLHKIKDLEFKDSIKIFLSGIESTDVNIQNIAMICMKKNYLDKEYYALLDDNSKLELKKIVYSLIHFDKNIKSLNRIADFLAKMYSNEKNQLSELLAYVVKTFESENEVARQFAIYIIEALCELGELKDDIVGGSVDNFNIIFKKGLSDTAVKVRISTLKATSQFLTNLSSTTLVNKFDGLFENMIDSLVYVLKNDSEQGLSALTTINSLAEKHPKFFKNNSELLINIICQILNESSFDNKIKTSAIEIINTLSSSLPVCMRKSNSFNTTYIPNLFNLLLDIDYAKDNELSIWSKSSDEDDAEKTQLYFTSRSALETLAINLGSEHMIKYCFSIIEKFVDSSNWIECHAGYIAIAFMAEGCKDIFKKNYDSITRKVCNGIVNIHPRVRWAALTALGMLLTFLAPTLQKKYHSELLPVLVRLLGNEEKELRVKTQSASAVVNFLKGLTQMNTEDQTERSKKKTGSLNKLLKPYVAGLLEALSGVFEFSLQSNYYPLQEETLTCLSLLATVLDKDFAPYYPMIMPGLKKVLFSIDSKNKEFNNLKANAVQTISYLCSSVSESTENFSQDFKEIATYFIKTLADLKEDDPLVPAILNAFSHLAEGLKEEFCSFYEILLPKLEEYLKADIDFRLEDAELEMSEVFNKDRDSTEFPVKKQEGLDGTYLRLQGVGDKKISVKTHVLQNKILAVEVLNNICTSMGKSFFPYLGKYLELSKVLMKFEYSRKIRKISIKCIAASLKCCSNDNEMKEIVDYYLDEVLDILNFHTQCFFLRDIKSTLKTLIETFEQITSTQVIQMKYVVKIYEKLSKIVSVVEEKKEKYKSNLKEKHETDENDADHIEQDMEMFNEVNRRVMEINGLLLSIYKEEIISLVFSNLNELFHKIWIKSITETKDVQESLYSVCFFNDLLEYAPMNDFMKLYPEYMKLCNQTNATDNDLIELIINGFGFISERLDKENFKSVKDIIFKSIYSILQKEDAFDNDELCMCTDNAISSFGKYCLFQCEPNEEGFKLTEEFLSLLPLNNDLEEGCEITKKLLEEIYSDNKIIMNDRIKPHLTQAFIRIQKMRLEDEEFLDVEGLGLLIMALPKLNIPFDG